MNSNDITVSPEYDEFVKLIKQFTTAEQLAVLDVLKGIEILMADSK